MEGEEESVNLDTPNDVYVINSLQVVFHSLLQISSLESGVTFLLEAFCEGDSFFGGVVPLTGLLIPEIDELDLEDEGGSSWNLGRAPSFPVGVVRLDGKSGFLPLFHGEKGYRPPLNDVV